MILFKPIKSSLLSVIKINCCHQVSRGLLFSRKKGVSRDFIAWIQQPIEFSPSAILRWMKRKTWKALVENHSYVPDRHIQLGPDLATAHFIVARDGAVKFESFNRWIKKNQIDGKYILPSTPSVDLRLEAVDASDTQLMYVSFDNLVNLQHLKYLSVAGCPNIDDWCLDRFVQFRDTLLVLDLSRCPRITERGLASLHKLRRLRRLILHDMPAVKNIALTALMLEEVLPGCVIEGINYTDSSSPSGDALPIFLKQYEQLAFSKEQEMINDLMNDGNSSNNNKQIGLERNREKV